MPDDAPDAAAWLVSLFEADLASGGAAASVPNLAPPPDGTWIPAAAASLRRDVVRRIHERHQFVVLEPADVAAIDRVYARSLAEAAGAIADDAPVRDRLLAAVMASHRERLDGALRAIADRSPAGVGNAVPCSEYTPELQLRVLGFETRPIPEPVLDLGCGSEARLVRHLRERGVGATGLDRDVDAELGIAGDWLTEPLEPGAWGAILSHLGFSLHFLHHHLGSESMAARYAKRMLEILRGVRPGGVFAYAPGLPFFEPLLTEAGYRIVRVRVPDPIARSLPPELARTVGDDVGYACQVWKR